jgi:hypothetical protein
LSTSLVVSILFKEFEKASLVNPHWGSKAKLEIPPGSEDILIVKLEDISTKLNYILLPRFKRPLDVLVSLAKTQGIKERRVKQQGPSMNIFVFTFRTKDEFLMVYVNEEKAQKFEEQVYFELENCSIAGRDDSSQTIHLSPGEEKVIIIQRDEEAEFFRCPIIRQSCLFLDAEKTI